MEPIKTAALGALRLLFRPIARIMLRTGVTWREFSEVCRLTFVEVASQEFGIRGRPTNISRISIMTGFSRREVRRLRNILDEESVAEFARMNSASRLLSGWHSDDDYTDDDGNPRLLPVADAATSFEALCTRYAGDVAPSTMLKELKRVGAVEEADDGRLLAKLRYYMPVHMDPEQMLISGSVLEDLGETVAYNLNRSDEEMARFERRATNTLMPKAVLPEFKRFLDSEGQAFLERVDAWLSEHENADAKEHVRLGLGTYWIENSLD